MISTLHLSFLLLIYTDIVMMIHGILLFDDAFYFIYTYIYSLNSLASYNLDTYIFYFDLYIQAQFRYLDSRVKLNRSKILDQHSTWENAGSFL